MNRARNLVFWQNVPSPHQAEMLARVAELWPGNVFLGTEQETRPDRKVFGWTEPTFGKVRHVRSSEHESFRMLASMRQPDDVHVFTGFLYHPVLRRAFIELQSASVARWFHSEAVDDAGALGVLRKVRDRVKAMRYATSVHGVLAMGRLGCGYFQAIGFDAALVHRFGYFVDHIAVEPQQRQASDSAFRLCFAGQLIHRKALDRVLCGLAENLDQSWTLDVVGEGPEREALQRLANDLSLGERVRWLGPRSREQVAAHLASSDLCVVPSRWDGWAVVVNESLLQGTPVLCSDRCGAADLIDSQHKGEVVGKFGWPEALRRWMGRSRDFDRTLVSRAVPQAGVAAERLVRLLSQRFH